MVEVEKVCFKDGCSVTRKSQEQISSWFSRRKLLRKRGMEQEMKCRGW